MRHGVAMILGFALLAGSGRAGWADDLPPLDMPATATQVKAHRHGKAVAPATAPSIRQISHDLLHGSDAQQALERTDNDMAGTRPIDHSNDEFGHEVKGQ